MIDVDILEIERLADILSEAAKASEDLVGYQRALASEMEQDPELAQFPQRNGLVEMSGNALSASARVSEALVALAPVIFSAAEEYAHKETELSSRLDDLLNSLKTIGSGIASSLAADAVVVEKQDPTANTDRVSQLVAGANEDIKIANIAAVTAAVKDELIIAEVVSDPELKRQVTEERENIGLAADIASMSKKYDDLDDGSRDAIRHKGNGTDKEDNSEE